MFLWEGEGLGFRHSPEGGDWATGIPLRGFGLRHSLLRREKCIKTSAQAKWHADSCGGDCLRYRDETFEGGARDLVRTSVWRERFAPKF